MPLLKKQLFWFFFLWASFPSLGLAEEAKIKALSQKPLQAFRLPTPSIHTLKNGLKVYLLENHELPTFEIFAVVKGGSLFDPSDQTGLYSMLATLLRTGGTEKHSTLQIDRLLEDRGASLETLNKADYTAVYLQSLSQDLKIFVPLFVEILSMPQFDPRQLELARAQKIETLKRINDEPEKVAALQYPRLVYGEQSAWGKIPTAASLNRIDRASLIQVHRRDFAPERTVLAITGDFKKEELLALLEKLTEGWKSQKLSAPLPAPSKKEWRGGIYGADKKGGQSTVMIGHLGERRFNPDKFALILMNSMLGGDIFSSRLGEEIRTSRGLAYSIHSSFGFESDYGLFYTVAQTKTESTLEVADLIEQEIRAFQNGSGLNEARLSFAKESLLNQWVGGWDPPMNYLKERARFSLYGYPEDYLEKFPGMIQKVTLAQVKAAAKKYLYPEKLVILVVGDLEKIGPALGKKGVLKTIPLQQ